MTSETTVTLKGWVLRDTDGSWVRTLGGVWPEAPIVFKTRRRAVDFSGPLGTPVRVEVTIREVGK